MTSYTEGKTHHEDMIVEGIDNHCLDHCLHIIIGTPHHRCHREH